jgi:predicted metal-dependent phosphoesterase TrpH
MFSKADTHIHTTYSDGKVSPETLVEYVVESTDLAVIAVTDHDTAEGGLAAHDHARRHKLPLDVIVGQEVSTDEGDVVGLFLHKSLPAYHTARAAIAAIHAQGGLAVAVHPFSAWATLGDMTGVAAQIATLPLDAVEVRNGFPTNLLSNAWTARVNRRGQRLSELGGSDSHVPFTVGQAFTRFPGVNAADLRRAILARQTQPDGPLWTVRSIAAAIPMLWERGLPSMTHVRRERVYGDPWDAPTGPAAPAPEQGEASGWAGTD